MPPRKATTTVRRAPVASFALAPGAAVRLSDGGEAIFLDQDGASALLRVGTAHQVPLVVPLESLSKVAEADETERHAKFRADASRRGEIEP